MIELRTLGGLDLRDSDGVEVRPILTQPKRLALLVHLALTPPPSFRRRDSIIALFWPELDQEHARGSLRQALRFLRRTLSEGVIVSRGEEEIGVTSSTLWCDAPAHELAIREFRRAIGLNPNLAEAHHWLGVVYWHIGLFEKAIEQFRETETIDAGNRLAQGPLAAVLTCQGHYEEGLRAARSVPREQNSPMWTYHVAWDLLCLGRSQEASTVIQDYLSNAPEDPGGLVTGFRAILHAKNGDARRAEEDIQRARVLGEGYGHFHHTAYNIASAYALLHRAGPAVQWLRRAVDDGLPCYPLLEKDPNLDLLRRDPDFFALMAELRAEWERWGRTL